jgi:hypothetical protein
MTADDYLVLVSYELRDLPWSTRRDLISEIRGHLAELPDQTDLVSRLGKPEQYAADMRAAAGLERRRGVIAFLQARRPRTLIATVLALTVIGLAIGAVAWVESYQPIAFAGGSYLPERTRSSIGLDGSIVTWRNGRPFRYGFTIVNNGRFPVRVLGVPYGPALPFTARLLTNGPSTPVDFMTGPYRRFQPFTLKPGAMTLLLLKGVYACNSGTGPGPSVAIDELPVRFSFLWSKKTVWIPLDGELVFDFPHGCTYQKP